MGQLMNQNEQDSAMGISQFQNKNEVLPSSCGSGPGGVSTTVNPNLAAFVLQNQQNQDINAPTDTGQNQLTDTQSLVQQEQSSNSSATGSQQQGPNFDTGGLEAVPAQSSTGLSTANTSQNEQQNMQASSTAVTQQQQDPVHQPSGEGFQAGNPNDTFTLTQTGVQHAGPGANQFFDIQGDCVTSGSCDVQQTQTSNAGTQTNSCTTSVCSISISNEEED
jgi:hypothetical protein